MVRQRQSPLLDQIAASGTVLLIPPGVYVEHAAEVHAGSHQLRNYSSVLFAAGNVKEKRLPPWTLPLSALIFPSWASVIERQIERPIPMPPSLGREEAFERMGTMRGRDAGPLSSKLQRAVTESGMTVRIVIRRLAALTCAMACIALTARLTTPGAALRRIFRAMLI
jgi:hypothetical protein